MASRCDHCPRGTTTARRTFYPITTLGTTLLGPTVRDVLVIRTERFAELDRRRSGRGRAEMATARPTIKRLPSEVRDGTSFHKRCGRRRGWQPTNREETAPRSRSIRRFRARLFDTPKPVEADRADAQDRHRPRRRRSRPRFLRWLRDDRRCCDAAPTLRTAAIVGT